MADIEQNYRNIRNRMAQAAESVGRDPEEITLVAVSKTQSVEAIRRLYDLGHRVFGENKLQEAIPKTEALPNDIEWHFIGKLQSNKIKRAAELFAVIQTIESESQIRELAKLTRPIHVLIEVNIAHEAQKSGIFAEYLDDFYQKLIQYDRIQFHGLMTVGPVVANPALTRSYFAELRRLSTGLGGKWLSMGMSNDFDVAIQEGATHVRVGSALFGERATQK